MIDVKYVCSNGKEYNLIGDKLRPTSGYFHKYKWKQKATDTGMGDNVYGFSKESITYDITLTVRGDLEVRKRLLDELANAWEYDIVNAMPGRMYFGKYYIECYILEMSNEVSSTWNYWTDCKVAIYCPYPFWAEESKKDFFPDEMDRGEEYDFLDYPYGYDYDYSRQKAGSQHWYIDHYRSNNFKMTIYGPCANPRITINEHVYQIRDTLEKGEYLVIDSRAKTVTKHLSNGTMQNIFAKREKESSVFELIPSGNLLINWSGAFGFEITVYKERSVPRWI